MATKTYTNSNTILGKTFRITTTVNETDTAATITTAKLEFAKSLASKIEYMEFSLYVNSDRIAGVTGLYTPASCGFTLSGSYYARTITVNKTVTKTHSKQSSALTTGFYMGVWTPEQQIGRTAEEWVFQDIDVDARPSYAVSYNANGGSGAPSAQTKWHAETLALSTTIPTRTNYVFKGWNTKADGTGTAYASGASYTANAAVTLYAQWYPPYTISYNANGGSGAPSAQTKIHNTTLTLAATKPTRTNYVFWHWNTGSTNGGTSYSPGASYTANAAATLYAIWNPLITYNANGDSVGGMPVNQTKTYGSAIALSSNVPTRTGYAFDGWYTNASGTGTKYEPGQSIAAGSNSSLALYAKWLKVPDPPRISSMSVVRCDSSGTADDEGTYGRVAVEWSVDTTSDTVPDNTGTVTGTIRADGGSSERAIAFSSGSSGTSGTAVAIVDNCDIDTQYLVTVTVTDEVASTTRTDILTRARFVLDFRRGGKAMGIGSAAPQDGLEVGWDAQFDKDLTVLGNIDAANLAEQETSTVSDVISPEGTWGVSSAVVRGWGYLRCLLLNVTNSTAMAAGSNPTPIGTLREEHRPRSMATFGCANGGGWVDTTGKVYFAPFVGMSANSSFYLSCTYYA